MATASSSPRSFLFQSISFKNIVLFLLILMVALVPLALRYYQDSRDYEISILASKLEFFAERGASWIDVSKLADLNRPEQMQTPAYRELVDTLNRIESDFGVDNAIVMRRGAEGKYTYIASGTGGTQAATNDGHCRVQELLRCGRRIRQATRQRTRSPSADCCIRIGSRY